jgi:FemAB-related protein (PEP-CTERM system-associated)
MARPEVTVTYDAAAWNAYVAAHPRATQYHQHEWPALLARSFGHRAIPLAALRDGRVVGVLPLVLMDSWLFGRFVVSLPFLNYGGVLGDTEDIEKALWDRAVETAREERVAYFEARHVNPHPFIPLRKQHKVTMVLDLAPTIEAQWEAFDPKLRNQIRKAERSGLTARMGGASDLPDFYDVFARNMRDLGTPVYGPRFFEEVLRAFPDSCRIFSVQSGRTVVAAGMALAFRDILEVPWAASLREFRSMCPNNLLYWELIQDAIKSGLRRFDFGRSTPGEGTYKFKEQWGAKPIPLAWEYWLPESRPLPDLSPKNAKYQAAIGVWKRLPVGLTKWLGPSIVRGIP